MIRRFFPITRILLILKLELRREEEVKLKTTLNCCLIFFLFYLISLKFIFVAEDDSKLGRKSRRGKEIQVHGHVS